MLRTLDQSGGKLNRQFSDVARCARLWPALVLLLACQGETGAPGEPGSGGQGEPGPQGPDGAPPDGAASLSAVAPGTFYVGHDVDVVISGYATTWTESAPPSIVFSDANLTAGPVTVASPTSLLTRVHVAEPAAIADATLTLTVGDLVYKGLSVERPLDVFPLWGASDDPVPALAQGSVALIETFQRDLGTPFIDPRISLRSVDGDLPETRVQLDGLSAYARTFLQLTDVDVTPGSYDLVVADVPAHTTLSVAPTAFTVVARPAQAIVDPSPGAPTSVSGAPGSPHATSLFTVTNEDAFDEWLHIRVSTNDVLATPNVVVLPGSGKFADRAKQAETFFSYSLFEDIHVMAAPNATHYLVTLDLATEATSPFTIDLGSDPVLNHDPNTDLLLESLDEPGATDLYHLSAQKDDQLVILLAGLGDVTGGPETSCGQFAASVFVVAEADGHVVYEDQDSICPGVFEFDPAQSCGGYWCPRAPIAITVPDDGNYLVYVQASKVLNGLPTFDYVTFIGVVP